MSSSSVFSCKMTIILLGIYKLVHEIQKSKIFQFFIGCANSFYWFVHELKKDDYYKKLINIKN